MKKLIFIMIVGICFTQTYEDLVILKNGSEIHGIIIEQKPNEYIKIQSGQNVFVFQMDEIEVMKKEIISNEDVSNNKSESNIFDKNHSIGIGIGTNKSFNILQYTYDLKLSDNAALFALLGYGNIFGLGITWQSNYNDDGFMVGWSGGMDVEGASFGSLSLSYQWRLKNSSNFISLGLSSNASVVTEYDWYYDEYVESTYTFVLPIISFDKRF